MVIRYHQQAQAMLDSLSCPSERKAALKQFSELMTGKNRILLFLTFLCALQHKCHIVGL